MLDFAMGFKFLFAFTFVISLMFLLSWALKRMGLATQVMDRKAARRLKIVEQLPVDARRRLLLVRRDGVEHLLMLGPSGETVIESGIAPIVDQTEDSTDEKRIVYIKSDLDGARAGGAE